MAIPYIFTANHLLFLFVDVLGFLAYFTHQSDQVVPQGTRRKSTAGYRGFASLAGATWIISWPFDPPPLTGDHKPEPQFRSHNHSFIHLASVQVGKSPYKMR